MLSMVANDERKILLYFLVLSIEHQDFSVSPTVVKESLMKEIASYREGTCT